MSLLEISLLVMVIVSIAGLVHGSVGFGFPMIATPLLSLITDLQTAIILTLLPTLAINLASIISEGSLREALKQYRLLTVAALLGSACGTLILIASVSAALNFLLAGMIVLYLVSDRLSLRLGWVQTSPRLAQAGFGAAAGVLGGLTNVMAPIIMIYAIESRKGRSEIIQATNLCFMTGKLMQLTLFSLHGMYGSAEILTALPISVLGLMALYLGFRVKSRIQPRLYQKILRVFLLVIAVLLVGKGLS